MRSHAHPWFADWRYEAACEASWLASQRPPVVVNIGGIQALISWVTYVNPRYLKRLFPDG